LEPRDTISRHEFNDGLITERDFEIILLLVPVVRKTKGKGKEKDERGPRPWENTTRKEPQMEREES
jgi:hypothetical protein